MSKASEYAKVAQAWFEYKPPLFTAGKFEAVVTVDGFLKVQNGETPISKDKAIALADWIYDTFGEKRHETSHA